MNNKIIRIIIGMIWLIGGVMTFINRSMEWWFSGLFLIVGASFLYSAFKGNKRR